MLALDLFRSSARTYGDRLPVPSSDCQFQLLLVLLEISQPRQDLIIDDDCRCTAHVDRSSQVSVRPDALQVPPAFQALHEPGLIKSDLVRESNQVLIRVRTLILAVPVFEQSVVVFPEPILLPRAFRRLSGSDGFGPDDGQVQEHEPYAAGVRVLREDPSPWPEDE